MGLGGRVCSNALTTSASQMDTPDSRRNNQSVLLLPQEIWTQPNGCVLVSEWWQWEWTKGGHKAVSVRSLDLVRFTTFIRLSWALFSHGISTIITNHPFSLDWMDSVSWHHMKPTAFWKKSTMLCLGFPGDTDGKEPAGQYRRPKRYGFRPWIRKAPGGGHGSPLQYSCLENPVDRGAWRATVHRLAKSWTRLKRFSAHAYLIILWFKKNYSLLLK